MSSGEDDLEWLILIDDICEEFQWNFVHGNVPRVEDYLDRVWPDQCSSLVRELVVLEALLRSEKGEHVSADEILGQYSDLLPNRGDRVALKLDIEKALGKQ